MSGESSDGEDRPLTRREARAGDAQARPNAEEAAGGATAASDVPANTPTAPVTSDDDADNRPPWFNGPGQEVGTVNVVTSGQVRSGYIGADGTYRPLTTGQLATLLAVPTDGRIVPITLGDLGSYRAVAGLTDEGAVITAIPTASADATVRGYVMVELIVAVVETYAHGITRPRSRAGDRPGADRKRRDRDRG